MMGNYYHSGIWLHLRHILLLTWSHKEVCPLVSVPKTSVTVTKAVSVKSIPKTMTASPCHLLKNNTFTQRMREVGSYQEWGPSFREKSRQASGTNKKRRKWLSSHCTTSVGLLSPVLPVSHMDYKPHAGFRGPPISTASMTFTRLPSCL